MTMPTPEVAKAKVIKLEGLHRRFLCWLNGIEFGLVKTWSNLSFHITHSDVGVNPKTITFTTDSILLAGDIIQFCEPYGITVELVKSDKEA